MHITSALVESILHRTSVIPFTFGKGSVEALGGYRDAMDRLRHAVDGYARPASSRIPVAAAASITTDVPASSAAAAPTSATPTLAAGTAPGAPAAVPAGWHADPYHQARLRWWDGAQWTSHTAA